MSVSICVLTGFFASLSDNSKSTGTPTPRTNSASTRLGQIATWCRVAYRRGSIVSCKGIPTLAIRMAKPAD
ncbi:hypothetical protein M8C21_020417, partial [Ambrosia artemisiifolia]